jgi:hypothetical protein
MIIVLGETDKLEINHSRYFFKICDTTHKIFIPKVDEIYYYIKGEDTKTKQLKSLLNILEFSNTFKIKTKIFFEEENIFLQELCNEYSNLEIY